jgi:hypothetical protein
MGNPIHQKINFGSISNEVKTPIVAIVKKEFFYPYASLPHASLWSETPRYSHPAETLTRMQMPALSTDISEVVHPLSCHLGTMQAFPSSRVGLIR